MSEFENSIKQSLSTGNVNNIKNILETALSSFNDEHELAWAIGVVFEENIIDAFKFIPAFLVRFPKSLHPVRVFYADILARQGQYDSATDEARIYLRLLSESNLMDNLKGKTVLLDGVSRAWLLLSSAYTEIGARSYSIRVINTGMNCPLPSSWIDAFKKELSQLNTELQSKELKSLDEKWEIFFQTADDWPFIDNLCKKKGFPLLRKRVELIKDNLKFKPSLSANAELLKIVQQNNNTFVLT